MFLLKCMIVVSVAFNRVYKCVFLFVCKGRRGVCFWPSDMSENELATKSKTQWTYMAFYVAEVGWTDGDDKIFLCSFLFVSHAPQISGQCQIQRAHSRASPERK
jgi:hypothetical protein